jgi:hypothetical protein
MGASISEPFGFPGNRCVPFAPTANAIPASRYNPLPVLSHPPVMIRCPSGVTVRRP